MPIIQPMWVTVWADALPVACVAHCGDIWEPVYNRWCVHVYYIVHFRVAQVSTERASGGDAETVPLRKGSLAPAFSDDYNSSSSGKPAKKGSALAWHAAYSWSC